jgi:hypothetical protein
VNQSIRPGFLPLYLIKISSWSSGGWQTPKDLIYSKIIVDNRRAALNPINTVGTTHVLKSRKSSAQRCSDDQIQNYLLIISIAPPLPQTQPKLKHIKDSVSLHNLITKGYEAISSLDVFGFGLFLRKGGALKQKSNKIAY